MRFDPSLQEVGIGHKSLNHNQDNVAQAVNQAVQMFTNPQRVLQKPSFLLPPSAMMKAPPLGHLPVGPFPHLASPQIAEMEAAQAKNEVANDKGFYDQFSYHHVHVVHHMAPQQQQ